MDNIIIIGSGNHHNTLGVIRSLGRVGLNIDLITIGSLNRNYVATSKFVTNHYPINTIEELSNFLNEYPQGDKKRIIISCADVVTEYLNLHRDKLSPKFIIPGSPIQGRMQELMDKATMISMIREKNILSPTIWHLPEERSLITFPCITKAYLSSHGGKSAIEIFDNEQNLDDFLKDSNNDIFVQAFINKKEEVQFIGCSLNGGEDIIIPGMTRILRSQANTNTGFLEYGPIDPFYMKTIANAKLYIKDCKYSGLFSIEFLRDQDDNIYFLEINFRNDGNAICVTEAGINLPLIWVKANNGEEYKQDIKAPRKIIVMPEFQDIKLVLQGKVSLRQWLLDWRRTDVFMEYAKDDKRPFFQYLINKLR